MNVYGIFRRGVLIGAAAWLESRDDDGFPGYAVFEKQEDAEAARKRLKKSSQYVVEPIIVFD